MEKMSERIKLDAKRRTVTGKKVNLLRAEGILPAVIYGKGFDPISIELDLKETTRLLRHVTSSTLVTINLEGEDQLTLIRDRQVNRLKDMFMHMDFLAIAMGQLLRTEVPIRLIGEPEFDSEFPLMVMQGPESLEVEVLPKDLPEFIEVDITNLVELGDSLTVGDLQLGDDVHILTDPDTNIAVIIAAARPVAEEEEEELEEGEGLEPEVIERGKGEDEEDEE
jgi:large subunit ribosomal protein L25